MPNVINGLDFSTGCTYTGPELGDTNLYDGRISDYYCPKPGDFPDALLPELILKADPSIISEIRVYAATCCVEFDPTSYTIEGLLGNGQWAVISVGQFNQAWVDAGTIGSPPNRNPGDTEINSTFNAGDPNMSFGFASFVNRKTYSEYRVTFPTLRFGSDDGYEVRVGELELVGRIVAGEENPTLSPTLVSVVDF